MASQNNRKSPPQLELNDHFTDAAIKSVQNAIQGLGNSVPVVQEIRRHKGYEVRGDISGVLGMIQQGIEGTMVLTFPKETIFRLLKKVYKDREFTELDNSTKQGVGELTNVVYCRLKSQLNSRGHQFKMSIPSVILGVDHSIANLLQEDESIAIQFSTEEGGTIFLQIALRGRP